MDATTRSTIVSAKSTVDMALSTATCGAFAIPTVGPVVAAGIAGGQFAFNVMFGILMPPEFVAYALPITKADVDIAVAQVKQAIQDSEFRTHTVNVGTFSDNYNAVWQGLRLQAADFSDTAWQYHLQTFNASTNDFFNSVDKANELADALKWVEDNASNNDTLGFYALASSLLVAYHNTALAWEFNNQMVNADKVKADYQAYLSNYDAWEASPPATRGAPPLTQLEPVLPSKEEVTRMSSLHGVRLYNEVLPRVTGYVSKFHTAWSTGWATRKSQIDAKKKEHFGTDTDKAKHMQLQVEWGPIYAYMWEDLTAHLGLTGVSSEGEINKLGDLLTTWNSIQADLATSLATND